MPRRPAATPENDPELARILEMRDRQSMSFPAIGTLLRKSGSACQLRHARYWQSQGVLPPMFRGTSPIVYPGDREPEMVRHPGPIIQPGLDEGASTLIAGAELTQLSANAHKITIPAERKAGWEKWMLATSDHHFDSTQCDRDLLAYHHELAAGRDAGIVCIGDALDLMQGRQDKRAGKIDLRPEYQTESYADAIVDDAAAWYGKYADRYWMISYGNHETNILKRLETAEKTVETQAGELKTLSALRDENKALADRVAGIDVLVAGQYVKRDYFEAKFESLSHALFDKLDRIEDKLDDKVSRAELSR